ncbi:MAG: sodium-dependent transporter [Synergistes sp.]|nr:sodium-dependent transporter [Synergistes sp.]
MSDPKTYETFTTPRAALIATLCAVLGLGNMWRFPYIMGTSGGLAFILVYLFFAFFVGVPLMISGFVMGRRARTNSINVYRELLDKKTPWSVVGLLGIIASILFMAFYSCIAGWVYRYTYETLRGSFLGIDKDGAELLFARVIGEGTYGASLFSIEVLMPVFWQFLVIFMIGAVLVLGVRRGIERVSKIVLPIIIVILLICAVRALSLPGSFEGVKFIMHFDFSKMSLHTVFTALGLAFFKLSLGMGVMMVYGSYFPEDVDIPAVPIKIVLIDICVSILAGLVIFPVVFSFGMNPGSGAELFFITIPTAFSQMAHGQLLLFIFYFASALAATIAALSVIEVPTAWLIRAIGASRKEAVFLICAIISLLSIIVACSVSPTGTLGMLKVFDMRLYEFIDFLSSNILLPLTGFLVAIFAGYVFPKSDFCDELSNHGALQNGERADAVRVVLRYLTPVLIFIIFLNSVEVIK